MLLKTGLSSRHCGVVEVIVLVKFVLDLFRKLPIQKRMGAGCLPKDQIYNP